MQLLTVTARVITELSGVLRADKLYPELHDHMFESAVESTHCVSCKMCNWVLCENQDTAWSEAKTAKFTGANTRK